MFNGEQQKKEIETIRERNITVKLSDADCERLVRKCGEHGLTVGELIANFVGDLVGGTYSNGSDERMYADQWFDRCWFGMFPEPTLLNHLLCWGYDPEDYLNTLDDIETAIKEKEYLAEHPEEADEEAQYLDDDIESWQEELLWSSIFVTLMANKIGGLQFGIYRNCQISSRVSHTAVAALPLTKANRSDFE